LHLTSQGIYDVLVGNSKEKAVIEVAKKQFGYYVNDYVINYERNA